MVERGTPEEVFAGLEVTLNVDSYPIKVPFKIDGSERYTPYTEKLPKSAYRTLSAYPTIQYGERIYVFEGWDDGIKNLTRTTILDKKTNYVMHYRLIPETERVHPTQPTIQPTTKVERPLSQPTVIRLQEATTTDYMPVWILSILVFGLTVCFLGYLCVKRS